MKMPDRLPFGQRLIKSLQQGIDDLKNNRPLRTTLVYVFPKPPKCPADRLRMLRGNLRLSLHEMAGLLNVSEETLKSWESGSSKPRGPVLRLIQAIEDPSLLARFATPKPDPKQFRNHSG